MKKVIIGLTGMVLIAVVVILFVNAQSGKAETKKATTEVAAKCGACPSASTCTEMKTATATTASCCDTTKTKEACETAKTEACPSAKAGCETTCPMKATLPVK
jgi:hypothetical protein